MQWRHIYAIGPLMFQNYSLFISFYNIGFTWFLFPIPFCSLLMSLCPILVKNLTYHRMNEHIRDWNNYVILQRMFCHQPLLRACSTLSFAGWYSLRLLINLHLWDYSSASLEILTKINSASRTSFALKRQRRLTCDH